MATGNGTAKRVRYKAQPNAHGVYYSLLKDGSKVFYVRHPANANGQRLYEKIGTRLDVAKKRAAEIRVAEEAPLSVATTLAEVIADWKATRRMRPASVETFDALLRLHIEPFFGRKKVREITPEMMRRWLNGLKRVDGKPGELSEATKRLTLSTLDLVLGHAVEIGALAARPKVARRHRPKPGESRKRILTQDEERTLIAYCARWPWVKPMITVALHQALRLGEVCALEWGDVDFVRGKLHVRRALGRDRTFGLPKGGKAATILLTPAAREALLELRGNSDGTGLVFHNCEGGPRQTRDVQRVFSLAIEAAGLPVTEDGKIVFHTLRHSGISRLANDPRIPPIQVQAFARHANLATTLGYCHVIEDDAINTAIAEALSGKAA